MTSPFARRLAERIVSPSTMIGICAAPLPFPLEAVRAEVAALIDAAVAETGAVEALRRGVLLGVHDYEVSGMMNRTLAHFRPTPDQEAGR